MQRGILSERDVQISIETFLLTSIQLAMHIYFNNLRTNPDVAISKDINSLKRLIANYNDFTTNMTKIPLNKLNNIHQYILIGELKLPYIITKLPYLSTEIDDNKFTEIFDFIYEEYYKKFESKVVETSIRRSKVTKDYFGPLVIKENCEQTYKSR